MHQGSRGGLPMRLQGRIAKLQDAAAVTSYEPLATLISFGRHAGSSGAPVVLFDGRDGVALDRKRVESTGQFLARVEKARSACPPYLIGAVSLSGGEV
ncbi:MAG: hypothetical protein AAGG72_09495 [Pseudomonadota bacterium]